MSEKYGIHFLLINQDTTKFCKFVYDLLSQNKSALNRILKVYEKNA